jgi:hypothetical protein
MAWSKVEQLLEGRYKPFSAGVNFKEINFGGCKITK